MRALGFTLLSLGILGCGGNALRDRALKDAAAARTRGDLVGEVLAMRQACAADPKDQDLCRKTSQLDQFAHTTTRASASAACSRVDPMAPATITGCLDAIRPIRQLYPGDPDADRMADVAGQAHIARCGAEPPADFPDSLRRARCIEAWTDAVATPGYRTAVERARGDAAAVLIALAGTRKVLDRPGARAALLGAAACLSGKDEIRRASEHTLRAFAESTAPTLLVRATGLDPMDLCTETARVAGKLTCAATPDSRAVVVEAKIDVAPIEHTVSERARTEKYLAGVDRVENPAYRERSRDEMYSREQARDAEATYRREQQGCDEATDAHTRAGYCLDCPEKTDKDIACRRADDAKAMWDERERDWRTAKDALDGTPAILEHENWRQTSFIVRDHTWSAPWQAELRALPGKTAHKGGVAQASDSEHGGSDLAQIAVDPLTPPGRGWYVPSVRTQVAAELAALVQTELATRVTTLQQKCPGGTIAWTDAAWLDCWAAAAVVAGIGSLGAELIKWETTVDDRKHGPGLPVPACR